MRVIRENLTASNSLLPVCQAAAQLLEGLAYAQDKHWHEDRTATRDLVKQIMALDDSSAGCPADTLDRRLNTLKAWAVAFLNLLGDSAAQAIHIGERLVADSERVLGPDDPDTLRSRNNLAVAYRAAGRTDEAITLHEQTLAAQERVLGPDHPDTVAAAQQPRPRLQDAGRTGEAITIFEQTLAAQERVLGPDHPDTVAAATTSPSPTRTRAVPAKRSRFSSRPWPPGNESWAPTTPTP